MSHAQQLHNRRSLDGSVQIIHRTGLPDHVTAWDGSALSTSRKAVPPSRPAAGAPGGRC